ncbi:hypothetical protein E1287_36105 [Actinomadura sp. KC06]|uniref:hypothetical protein n=1 Tax=Actinomadura sp. KC06 TaxID=2530369 RepID=UPI001049CB5C|nr:hypothetical protein [Actinomadura sp. KC06]TDD26648.1 hypothetical protein E1287_36105 [Actinomadura sp. KC06]
MEFAKARLRSAKADEESIDREFREVQEELYRSKAHLTALLGAAFIDRVDAGAEPSDIAYRALISTDELWLLLSGTYEVTETAWLRRVAAGFMATGRNWSVDKLRRCLDEFEHAVMRSQAVTQRREALRQRISDAEGNLRRVTADLATQTVKEELRRAGNVLGESGVGPVVIPDVQGYECKPDPLAANSAFELLDLLRRYREWAGNPSYRDMAERVPGGPSYGTLANILRLNALPKKLATLEAFIRGSGGGDEDVRSWATAWRRLTTPPDSHSRRADG